MFLSCTVSEIWPDIGRKSENRRFNLPHLFDAPVWGDPVKISPIFLRQKTVPVLSCGVICVILRSAVLVQSVRPCYGRTDIQADGHTTTSYTALA